ncbi:GDSL-type esterase/lipase family protein [Echinicola vietnamensis]|uniref:Lysophospholipase L1-like esterase n=1 Tax=Echinicola vietnamensis (strain DSM 17526 / LMG 23754 / KMM 6221) TaxID=926556 RepID=L0G5F4_ECHVK|nr:GDSL-type esterase/lipase family protein [Echinicola vietnamensis]AGA80523.1 lysophospholipase L1-like esterase [Echinicola vietnamensis DSM 17526]
MKILKKNSNRGILFLIILFLLTINVNAQTKIKVACIGNSVTYGLGISTRNVFSYPARLQFLLGKEYEVKNYGHSGATLLRKGHRPYSLTKEFGNALTYKPDIAIINLGLNDTDPRNWPDYGLSFEADYAWLIEQFRNVNPNIEIYVGLLTPIFSGHPRFGSGTHLWHKAINNKIVKVAHANGVGLIDLFTPLVNRPDLFPDHIHPIEEGAAIMANTVCSYLVKDFGGLKIPELFADGMVLQRGDRIPVFGRGNPDQVVTVDFQGKKRRAVVDSGGNWILYLTGVKTGGPFVMEIHHSEETITLKDVSVGDVWLCMGQSNMDFPLQASRSWRTGEVPLKNQNIRLFKFHALKSTDNIPWDRATLEKVNGLGYFKGSWNVERKGFSAIGYHFGVSVQDRLKVPIGIVQLSLGGAPIEAFMDKEVLWDDPQLVNLLKDWINSDYIMPWVRERATVNMTHKVSERQRHPYQPSYIYDAALCNIVPFGIKGILWYQGESNTHNPGLYKRMFFRMIEDFRKKWQNDRLPVYFVQLPGMDRPSWPCFRKMQHEIDQELSFSEMAVTLDLGDSLNVHPAKKREVGERLAIKALSNTYSMDILANAPKMTSVEDGQDEIIVSFEDGEGLCTLNGESVMGFELVNAKGQSVAVRGNIKGGQVKLPVHNNFQVKEVRYGFKPFTRANLSNMSGMPMGTSSIKIPSKISGKHK